MKHVMKKSNLQNPLLSQTLTQAKQEGNDILNIIVWSNMINRLTNGMCGKVGLPLRNWKTSNCVLFPQR